MRTCSSSVSWLARRLSPGVGWYTSTGWVCSWQRRNRQPASSMKQQSLLFFVWNKPIETFHGIVFDSVLTLLVVLKNTVLYVSVHFALDWNFMSEADINFDIYQTDYFSLVRRKISETTMILCICNTSRMTTKLCEQCNYVFRFWYIWCQQYNYSLLHYCSECAAQCDSSSTCFSTFTHPKLNTLRGIRDNEFLS